ncbi:hypothetical protein FJY71_00455 [candidate division WOR-3 bacterium]|nr:hypothetical protein [candidate division WOR-3 bacterium]
MRLEIRDLSGRAVRTLASGVQQPGRHGVVWNGTDDQGRRAARGVYFVRLDVPGHGFAQKAVMVR